MEESKEVEVSPTEIEPVETEVLPATPDTDAVVEQIVNKWNELVTVVQNTTIGLCLMIKSMTKDFPDETVKDILKKVKAHPNIKRFVSIDRIWQGMRLINKRPDLIEYSRLSEEEKEAISEHEKPYIKKDGEVFWEFYFELAKQPLSDNTIMMLEMDGKANRWSYRELRSKIQEVKDENDNPGGFETRRQEKAELIKKISGICRQLQVEKLRGVLTLCQDFHKESMEHKKEE